MIFILMGYRMPSECLNYLHAILERMELTINTDKTHLLNARQEPFNFWALHLGMYGVPTTKQEVA